MPFEQHEAAAGPPGTPAMGMESAITLPHSVDIVGAYQPLESGFNYKELGVVPQPVSAYK